MEKSWCLFIFLCSAMLEAQSLECYVCDNCPKVKLNQIQTCGPTIISEPSTTITTTTESPTTVDLSAKIQTSSTSTTLIPSTILTTTSSEATTTSSIVMTEEITISMKTTGATSSLSITTEAITSTTETRPFTTESKTSTEASSAITIEPINTSMSIPTEPINSSNDTTGSASNFPSATTEAPFIKVPTGPLTTESMALVITDATSSIATSTEATIIPLVTVSESVISSEPITESNATDKTVSFISMPPTTMTVPIGSFLAGPALQSNTLPSLSEQNTEPTIQNNPPTSFIPVRPIANFATESATTIPIISATNYPGSLGINTRPEKQKNSTNNLRRIRSTYEGCVCENEEKCDCLTHERSRRYTLRGLGLSKEGVKYVCFVDNYKINETEVVKRGCAIKEDEKTLCKKLGSGNNCKICNTNQCNSAAIIQSSILLMFSLYLLCQ